MIKPTKLVNITSSIQSTELSKPLALASRATHTSSAMLRTNRTAINTKNPPQQANEPAAAAAASASLGVRLCAKRGRTNRINRERETPDRITLAYQFVCQAVNWLLPLLADKGCADG
jgi:hypothetical protein